MTTIATVTAFRSEDGQLHNDPVRYAAANLCHRLPKRFSDSNGKVLEFSDCLRVIEHRDLIETCFRELDAAVLSLEPGLTDAEQKAQGSRCGCRGADDLCVCQNVPDAETRKARAPGGAS